MSEEENDIIPDASVDITTVVCPTTFVKAKVALDELDVGQVLSVRLNDGEAVANVPLAYDDEIRIGLLSRADMSLSRPGTAFADALRARVAQLV